MNFYTVKRTDLPAKLIELCGKKSGIKVLTPLNDECIVAMQGTDIRVWSGEQEFVQLNETFWLSPATSKCTLWPVQYHCHEESALGRIHYSETKPRKSEYQLAKCTVCGQVINRTQEPYFYSKIRNDYRKIDSEIGWTFVHVKCLHGLLLPTLTEDMYNRIPETNEEIRRKGEEAEEALWGKTICKV